MVITADIFAPALAEPFAAACFVFDEISRDSDSLAPSAWASSQPTLNKVQSFLSISQGRKYRQHSNLLSTVERVSTRLLIYGNCKTSMHMSFIDLKCMTNHLLPNGYFSREPWTRQKQKQESHQIPERAAIIRPEQFAQHFLSLPSTRNILPGLEKLCFP